MSGERNTITGAALMALMTVRANLVKINALTMAPHWGADSTHRRWEIERLAREAQILLDHVLREGV